MNVEQAQVPGSGQGMAADALAALAGTAGLAALGPIMDLLPVGIYVLGGGSPEELVVLAENSAAAAIHGATIPPGSAPYSMPYALYGPDRREPLPPESLPAYRVVASGGAVANQEIHVLRPDGEWRVLLANAAPVHMGGRVAGAVLAFQDVTEGKRVEEALRESEARFRALADSNIIGVAFADPVSGAVWDANDEYLRIIGRTRAELQAGTLNWKAITPPETVEGEERRADHPPPDGRGRPYEKEYVRPDGTRVPVIIGGAYLAPRQVVAFVLDNSERRQVQEALRESEERFRTFTRQSRDGIIMVDSAGRIVEWNEGEEALTGISRSEALGRPLWEVQFRLAPGERRTATFAAAARKVIVKGLKEGIHLRRLIEEEIERPDGSRRFVQSRIFAIQSGREILACAICRDITARKQMEDALRESEEQLRLFVAHTPAAVAMFDTEMRYLLASRRWLADYHLGERDIIGRSHYEVFPEIPERWKEIHRRCLAGAVERAEADPFPRADGRTDWVRWEIHPWRKSSKAIGGLIVFSEVITTRIEAEVRTTTLREMAAALSAAATCEQIAAVVAGRALPGVGAESGGIYLLDEAGEALHLVGGAGTPPEWADAARRLPLSAATLTTAVVRTGKAVWVENGNEIPALFPDSPALHPSGAARAAIPLVVDGRVLGALSFLFAAPRRFSEGQRVLMREFAGLAAQAVVGAGLLYA